MISNKEGTCRRNTHFLRLPILIVPTILGYSGSKSFSMMIRSLTKKSVMIAVSIYRFKGGCKGSLLGRKIHPRKLWSALNYATPEVQAFILEKIAPLLHPHDREDPLGRKHGAPSAEDLGEFGLVETTNPFWRKDNESESTAELGRKKGLESQSTNSAQVEPVKPRHILKFPGR